MSTDGTTDDAIEALAESRNEVRYGAEFLRRSRGQSAWR
jgi:hypothetical protein